MMEQLINLDELVTRLLDDGLHRLRAIHDEVFCMEFSLEEKKREIFLANSRRATQRFLNNLRIIVNGTSLPPEVSEILAKIIGDVDQFGRGICQTIVKAQPNCEIGKSYPVEKAAMEGLIESIKQNSKNLRLLLCESLTDDTLQDNDEAAY